MENALSAPEKKQLVKNEDLEEQDGGWTNIHIALRVIRFGN